MRRCIFGVGVLNWYPNRNPSEETKITTGWFNLDKGRAFESNEEVVKVGVVEVDGFEKKRKAKAAAAERAMQVMSSRKMKTMVGL